MLAEEAVEATSEPSPVELPVPKSVLKQHFQTALETRLNARWTKAKTAAQSRTFWPCIDLAKSQQLLQWDRPTFTKCIRFFTGHNNLNSHRTKTKETDDDTCRLCLEGIESSEHLLCQCVDLTTLRSRAVGQPILPNPTEFSRIPLSDVRLFILLICQRLQEEGLEEI